MVSYTVKQTVVENLNADLDGKQPAGDYPTNASLTESLQSNLLNYTTNRILEIPQDIKLELNNGTLTLKSGSKVYIPNGFEQDGTTPKFDVVTIENDIVSQNFNRSGTNFIRYESGFLFCDWPVSAFSSSSNTSSVTGWYYDTSKNEIKYYNSGVAKNHTVGFPLGVATVSNSVVNSIDQVFNGFGYIGSTLFLLPGVKTVVPDGRNEDGTCKNKAPSTVSSVKTETISRAVTAYVFTNFVSSTIAIHHYVCSKTKPIVTETTLWYNPETNLPSQVLSNGTVMTPYGEIPLAKFTSDSTGKITSFEPFTVDSVVNSNASNFSQAGRSYLFGLSMPSNKYINLTLGASGSTYTAPANGWFSIQVEVSGNNLFFGSVVSGDYGFVIPIWTGGGSIPVRVIVPCTAGRIFKTNYNCTINAVSEFRFIYAQSDQ